MNARSGDSMTVKKTRIEVAFPLDAINQAAAREQCPAHRHRSAATIAPSCGTEVCV